MTMTRTPAGVANDALTRRLIDLASQGQRPRCGDSETAHLWLSEYEGERKQAALMCSGCPILEPCDAVGQYQRFGTWSGIDRTRPPGKAATHDQHH